jgi:hypothetical protein
VALAGHAAIAMSLPRYAVLAGKYAGQEDAMKDDAMSARLFAVGSFGAARGITWD